MSGNYLQLVFSAFMKKLTFIPKMGAGCGSIILRHVNRKYDTLFQLGKLCLPSKMQNAILT